MRSETAMPMSHARFGNQPVSAKENSPPFQRWVRSRSLSSPVRDGRKCGFVQRGFGIPLSSLRDLADLGGANPALKRWAFVDRPYGLDDATARRMNEGERNL